jgi:hypothetical protein
MKWRGGRKATVRTNGLPPPPPKGHSHSFIAEEPRTSQGRLEKQNSQQLLGHVPRHGSLGRRAQVQGCWSRRGRLIIGPFELLDGTLSVCGERAGISSAQETANTNWPLLLLWQWAALASAAQQQVSVSQSWDFAGWPFPRRGRI